MGCHLTHVERHVEINLKLIDMASGVKTHTFGRHVENVFCLKKKAPVTWQVCEMLSDVLFLRAGVFNFFSFWCLKRKAPIELGAM